MSFKPSKDRYKHDSVEVFWNLFKRVSNPQRIATNTIFLLKSAILWREFQTLKGSLQTVTPESIPQICLGFKPSKDRYKPGGNGGSGGPGPVSNPQRIATNKKGHFQWSLVREFQTLKGSLQTTCNVLLWDRLKRVSNPQRIATNSRPSANNFSSVRVSNPQRIATNKWRFSPTGQKPFVSNPQRIATNEYLSLHQLRKSICFKPSKDRYKLRNHEKVDLFG